MKTALLQIAAEELKVPFAGLTLITADTNLTPDEGYTAASHSMQDSGTAIRNAAAQVRDILVSEAARRLGLDKSQLRAVDGAVVGPSGAHIPYRDLVRDQLLSVEAQPTSSLTATVDFTVMNHPVPRVDIPAKVTGGPAYVQDMRPHGMLHGRMVRPPSPAAKLDHVDTSTVERLPGVVKVVHDGDVLGVIAEDEWMAIQAMRRLATMAVWAETPSLPDETTLATVLTKLGSQDTVILDRGRPGAAGQVIQGTFARPYLAHASIGPSCAIAEEKDGAITVWTHTQGVFPLRKALAEMLRRPVETVHCIHVEGAGCYGHNGADDVGADAALLASAVPGRPVRVQWMREQEHAWEPFGPGMVVKVRAVVAADGSVADWHHEVWSQSHMMRPGPAGALLAARGLASPFPPAPPVELAQPEGGGDRNAIPLYALPNAQVVHHFLPEMPLRGSSLRSLGGYFNVHAIETTIDDLARTSGQDLSPSGYAIDNRRARAVIETAADSLLAAAQNYLPEEDTASRSRNTKTSRPTVPSRWKSGSNQKRATSGSDASPPLSTPGKSSIRTAFATRSPRITVSDLCYSSASASIAPGSPRSIGPLTRSCALPACRRRSMFTSSTDRERRFSALPKPPKGQRVLRSAMLFETRSAAGCMTCR